MLRIKTALKSYGIGPQHGATIAETEEFYGRYRSATPVFLRHGKNMLMICG
jgi:hypothetical protein